MPGLGDLGVGSTDLETWTNMGRVGIRLGPGWGPAEPRPQDGEDRVSQADLALTLGWAGLGPPGPSGPSVAIHGQLTSRQGSGVTGHRLYRGDSHPCVQARPTCGQAQVWASLPDRLSGGPRGGV